MLTIYLVMPQAEWSAAQTYLEEIAHIFQLALPVLIRAGDVWTALGGGSCGRGP